jgi:hypothetical protein
MNSKKFKKWLETDLLGRPHAETWSAVFGGFPVIHEAAADTMVYLSRCSKRSWGGSFLVSLFDSAGIFGGPGARVRFTWDETYQESCATLLHFLEEEVMWFAYWGRVYALRDFDVRADGQGFDFTVIDLGERGEEI